MDYQLTFMLMNRLHQSSFLLLKTTARDPEERGSYSPKVLNVPDTKRSIKLHKRSSNSSILLVNSPESTCGRASLWAEHACSFRSRGLGRGFREVKEVKHTTTTARSLQKLTRWPALVCIFKGFRYVKITLDLRFCSLFFFLKKLHLTCSSLVIS